MPCATIVAVLALTCSAAAPPTPARLQSLVAQLGAKDFRARERADKTLRAIGDRVLPALKALLPATKDPEAHRRLAVIVGKLRVEQLGSPRRVTLRVKDQTIKDIIAELSKQSGYQITLQGGSDDRRFSFDLENVPFWNALDQVCDQTAYYTNQLDDHGVLVLFPNETYNPHVCYAGPFKIVANNINGSHNLQLAGWPRRQPILRRPESLSLQLTVQAEPKAPIVGVGEPAVTKAIDENGASLLPARPNNGGVRVSRYAPRIGYRSFNHGLGLSLSRTDRRAETIKELRGTVRVALLDETRPELTVDNLLAVKNKTFPGRTVNLEVIGADYQISELRLEVNLHLRPSGTRDSGWQGNLYQRLEVTDANGVRFQYAGLNRQAIQPGLVSLVALFRPPVGQKVGKPHRLQYVEWKTVTREVPFSFTGVPLP